MGARAGQKASVVPDPFCATPGYLWPHKFHTLTVGPRRTCGPPVSLGVGTMACTYSARISTVSLSIFLLGVENALTCGSGVEWTPPVSGWVDGWDAWGGDLGGQLLGQWEGIKYRRRRPSQPLLLLSPLWVGVLASSREAGPEATTTPTAVGEEEEDAPPLVYVFLPLRRSGGSSPAPRRRRRRRRPPPRTRLRPPIYAPGAPRLEQVLVDAQVRPHAAPSLFSSVNFSSFSPAFSGL